MINMEAINAKALTVHERLSPVYGAPIRFFSDKDPLSELVSALLSHRTRNRDSGAAHALLEAQLPDDWDAQAVYDNHELLMLHGQQVCHYKKPACERCVLTELCDYYAEHRGHDTVCWRLSR